MYEYEVSPEGYTFLSACTSSWRNFINDLSDREEKQYEYANSYDDKIMTDRIISRIIAAELAIYNGIFDAEDWRRNIIYFKTEEDLMMWKLKWM